MTTAENITPRCGITIDYTDTLQKNVVYQVDKIDNMERSYFEKTLLDLMMYILLKHEITAQGVNLVFCDNPYIKTLNRKFRHKDKVTDVLSFPFQEPDFLGEIYISLDYVAENDRMFGSTYAEEIVFLLIHGLLHLLDYSHDTAEERQEMQHLEQLYFREAVKPYAPC